MEQLVKALLIDDFWIMPPTPQYIKVGIPYITSKNIKNGEIDFNKVNYISQEAYENISKKRPILVGDILISMIGTLGETAVVKETDGVFYGQNMFLIRLDEKKINKKYFLYYFKSNTVKQILEGKRNQSTQKYLKANHIEDLAIPTPSLEKQRRIVELLDKIASIILLRKNEIKKLDEFINARFVEMFGDPESNIRYPQVAIKELTDVVSGGTPDRKNNIYWEDGTIPWVKTTELQNNRLTEVEEYITERGLNESSAKIVPKDTVLIAMYGQGKTRGMTGFLNIAAATNQACACLLPSEKIEAEYLWQYMIMSYDRLRNLAQGGNQPNLNGNMIKGFTVLVPPKKMQISFVNFVKQVDKSKAEVQKSLDEAQVLFDSLMQQYFG